MIDLRGSSNSTFGKAARALLVVSVCYFIAYGIAAYARMEPVFVIRMAVLALLLIAVRYLWMHGGGSTGGDLLHTVCGALQPCFRAGLSCGECGWKHVRWPYAGKLHLRLFLD